MIRFECATYGEAHGGHVLLSYTGSSPEPFQEIIGQSDRPPYSPVGLVWSPYLSGFRSGDRYVIMKTFPDPSASRTGMVFSFALLAEAKIMSRVRDLQPVLDLLPQVINKDAACVSIQLDSSVAHPVPTADRRLCECLIAAGTRSSAIWLGNDQAFVDQIVALWARIWPETRLEFSFRLAFDPQDVVSDQPTLVATPIQLESRWARFPVVQHWNAKDTLAGAALADVVEGEALRVLKDSLEAKITNVRDLLPLEDVLNTLNTDQVPTDNVRSALLTVAQFCPNPEEGSPQKAQLLSRAAAAIAAEHDPAEIRAFRNLNASAFVDREPLVTSIEQWISVQIIESQNVLALVNLGFEESNYLSAAVLRGIRSALQSPTIDKARRLWSWIEGLPSRSVELVGVAVSAGWQDALLAQECPSRLPQPLGQDLLYFAKNNGLYSICAAILTAVLPPDKALADFIGIGLPANHPALNVIIERLGPDTVVGECITIGGQEPLKLATEAIRRDPTQFRKFNTENPFWLRLLDSAIVSGIPLSALFMGSLCSQLLDYSIDGQDALSSLVWQSILQSCIEILDYPRRPELWTAVPVGIRSAFLVQTASRWLDRFEENPGQVGQVESPLEAATINTAASRSLTPSSLLQLVTLLPSMNEDAFIRCMQVRKKEVGPSRLTAEAVGDLVSKKRWADAASAIYGWCETDGSLRPALARCSHLLGRWQRLRARWVIGIPELAPTLDELWETVEELAIELYTWGPGEHAVWERAGGDPAAIRIQSTGRDSWHDVIGQSRHGGGGVVTLSSLAAVMLQDFPWNEVLQKISKHIINK